MDILRKDTAKHMRSIHKAILQGNNAEVDSEPVVWNHKWLAIGVLLAILLIMCLLSSCSYARAPYTPDDAIRTIVGEASNQGYIGMVCVGEVIRQKGSLRGFYGLHVRHAYHEPKWVWIQARKAWLASAKTYYTHGADHFENIRAFGEPYWVKTCVLTFEYRDHRFYKTLKKG